MGVTISGKNTDIDLPYFGFARLRTTVASVSDAWLGRHYKKMFSLLPKFFVSEEERKRVFSEYDNKWKKRLAENPKLAPVINFIYSPDCDGELSVDDCKGLFDIIKDFDDSTIYGYAGRTDPATFRDFKEVLSDCIDNNCSMTWS